MGKEEACSWRVQKTHSFEDIQVLQNLLRKAASQKPDKVSLYPVFAKNRDM